HTGHSKVGNYQLRQIGSDSGKCLLAAFSSIYVVTAGFKSNRKKSEEIWMSIDQQDFCFGVRHLISISRVAYLMWTVYCDRGRKDFFQWISMPQVSVATPR